MINGGLLGEELAFVMTPQGSPVSSLYSAKVVAMTGRCEAQRELKYASEVSVKRAKAISLAGANNPGIPRGEPKTRLRKLEYGHFGAQIPIPGVVFATSFPANSTWGNKAHQSLLAIEVEYVDDLLISIRDHNVEGAIAEFGVLRVGGRVIYLKPRKGSRSRDLS